MISPLMSGVSSTYNNDLSCWQAQICCRIRSRQPGQGQHNVQKDQPGWVWWPIRKSCASTLGQHRIRRLSHVMIWQTLRCEMEDDVMSLEDSVSAHMSLTKCSNSWSGDSRHDYGCLVMPESTLTIVSSRCSSRTYAVLILDIFLCHCTQRRADVHDIRDPWDPASHTNKSGWLWCCSNFSSSYQSVWRIGRTRGRKALLTRDRVESESLQAWTTTVNCL